MTTPPALFTKPAIFHFSLEIVSTSRRWNEQQTR